MCAGYVVAMQQPRDPHRKPDPSHTLDAGAPFPDSEDTPAPQPGRAAALPPNRLDLRADGLPPAGDLVVRLGVAALAALRHALGEVPLNVSVAPDPRGGIQASIIFSNTRPALAGYEVADVQAAWARAVRRTCGSSPPSVPGEREIAARREDLSCAWAELRAAQLQADPPLERRVWIGAALNRVQVAHDALRRTLARADPVRSDRRVYRDTLGLRLRMRGLKGLPVSAVRRALRRLLARAAALPDASELRLSVDLTPDPNVLRARVRVNFRNTRARGEAHLNPASLGDAILAAAPAMAPMRLRFGGVSRRVSIEVVERIPCPLVSRRPHSGGRLATRRAS